jgi:hypothetical protein
MIINSKSISLIFLLVFLVPLCLILMAKGVNILDGLELTFLFIFIAVFLFLFIGLYKGATVIGKPHIPPFRIRGSSFADFISKGFWLDAGDTIGGFILGIIFTSIFSLVLCFVLTFFITIGLSIILMLAFVLFWIFYRALHLVFLNSQTCKGSVYLSSRYALQYSALYSGFVYVLLLITAYVSNHT